MDKQKIFGVYIRVSTEKQAQDGDSIEMQENLAKNYIKDEDGILYKVYVEPAVSATKTKLKDRKILMECLNDAKSGLFNNLIVYRRDRLARNTEDSLAIRKTLEENNCELHFTATGEMQMMLNDPYGKLMENIHSSLAEIESAQTATRVSDTMNDKASRGEFTGGNVTYGYQNINGCLKPIESEIPIIKEIVNLYLQGYGKHSIARWLEGYEVRGIGKRHARPTKLKQHSRSSPKWTIDTIDAILFNKTYSGYMDYKGKREGDVRQTVKSPYIEPIRSEELQQRIDKLRMSKREKMMPPRKYNTPFLLTGIIVCAECGREYASRTVTKENGKRYSYYICKGRSGKSIDVCQSKTYKKEVVEQFVLEESKGYVEQFINSDIQVAIQKGLEEKDNSLSDKLMEVERKIAKKNKDLQAYKRLILDLDVDDDMYTEMRDMYQEDQKGVLLSLNNLKKSREELNAELETQSDDKIDLEQIVEQLKDYSQAIDVAPVHLQKQLLDKLFSKIEIDANGNIKYTLSLPLEKVEQNRKVGFSTLNTGDSVLGFRGVGDTTPPKNITIKSDEIGYEVNFFKWHESLVNMVSDTFYTFIINKNPEMKSPTYFEKKSGLSWTSHRYYRTKRTIPTFESAVNILEGINSNIDEYVSFLKEDSIICNRIILEHTLNDANVIKRSVRRLHTAY